MSKTMYQIGPKIKNAFFILSQFCDEIAIGAFLKKHSDSIKIGSDFA